MSKRERTIAISVMVVVGLAGVWLYLVEPLTKRGTELKEEITQAKTTHDNNERTLLRSQQMNTQWSNVGGKSLKPNVSEADGQLLNSIGDWAKRSGMNLASVKPERPEKEKGFQRITYRATGTGRVKEIADFLIAAETASIPVNVSDVQLSTRKEGSDDISVMMSISTICLAAPEPDKTAKPATPKEN